MFDETYRTTCDPEHRLSERGTLLCVVSSRTPRAEDRALHTVGAQQTLAVESAPPPLPGPSSSLSVLLQGSRASAPAAPGAVPPRLAGLMSVCPLALLRHHFLRDGFL